MLGLIEKCEGKVGSTVTVGNLFTSVPLLDEPMELGINGFCTLRQNHFQGQPVTNKTTFSVPSKCFSGILSYEVKDWIL